MTEPDPVWLPAILAATREDTREIKGPGSNAFIAGLYRTLGLDPEKYGDDASPWCAIFANAMLKRSGYRPWVRLFAARGALGWGMPLTSPKRGCVVVLDRVDPKQPNVKHGHVTFYLGETRDRPGWFDGVGGNQRNQVCVASYDSGRVIGWRLPTERLP